jgi:hypothetical protein
MFQPSRPNLNRQDSDHDRIGQEEPDEDVEVLMPVP